MKGFLLCCSSRRFQAAATRARGSSPSPPSLPSLPAPPPAVIFLRSSSASESSSTAADDALPLLLLLFLLLLFLLLLVCVGLLPPPLRRGPVAKVPLVVAVVSLVFLFFLFLIFVFRLRRRLVPSKVELLAHLGPPRRAVLEAGGALLQGQGRLGRGAAGDLALVEARDKVPERVFFSK